VERVSLLTQSTAANAEESASAAEELTGQARVMRQLVQSFVVGTGNGATRTLARRDVNKPPPAAYRDLRRHDQVVEKWATR
jgi:hypothetical protein